MANICHDPPMTEMTGDSFVGFSFIPAMMSLDTDLSISGVVSISASKKTFVQSCKKVCPEGHLISDGFLLTTKELRPTRPI